MTSLRFTKAQSVTAGKLKNSLICYQTKLKTSNQLSETANQFNTRSQIEHRQ